MLLNEHKQRLITHSYFFFALIYLLLLNDLAFPLKTLLKPLPIFILLLSIRHLRLGEAKWSALLWALVFSLAGDIALTFDYQESFLAGLSFFIIAHLCYITFFFEKLKLTKTNSVLILALCIIALGVMKLLLPAAGELKAPVAVYCCVLITMVLTAQLNQTLSHLTKLGTLLFMLSDGLLAKQLFIPSSLNLEPLIMASYYLAQFFIVRGLPFKFSKGAEL